MEELGVFVLGIFGLGNLYLLYTQTKKKSNHFLSISPVLITVAGTTHARAAIVANTHVARRHEPVACVGRSAAWRPR